MRELIIGGARSGKSTLALQRAHDSGRQVLFVATARADDAEMHSRILLHRSERPSSWQTVEASTQLAATLQQWDRLDLFIIVDCLTLWLSNVLCSTHSEQPRFDEAAWDEECSALIEFLPRLKAEVVLVSNEVGFGIVPDNAVARRFRDEQGRLNQRVAACCEQVTLVVAGIPLMVKANR